jgi:hypothetical protein
MGTAGCLSLLYVADGFAGSGAVEELMNWQRSLAALFVVLALAGCPQGITGQAGPPYAPYQQDDPRDSSGMH